MIELSLLCSDHVKLLLICVHKMSRYCITKVWVRLLFKNFFLLKNCTSFVKDLTEISLVCKHYFQLLLSI